MNNHPGFALAVTSVARAATCVARAATSFARVATSVALVSTLAILPSTIAAQDGPAIPVPDADIAVGTHTMLLVDKRRKEIATDDPKDKRELVVQLWYRCDPKAKGEREAYLPSFKTLEPSLSEVYRAHGESLASLRVPALRDAKPESGKRRYPIVVFSPGIGTSRLFYTSQILALAQRGFLVAAVDHTYDCEGVVFPDGSLKRRLDPQQSEVEGTPKPGQGLRAGPRLLEWAKDLEFVVARMLELDKSKKLAKGLFRGRIDKKKIGIVGHCFGGRAALLAAANDPRVGAVIVENAWPLVEDSREGKLRASVLFAQGAKTKEVLFLESSGAKATDLEKLRKQLADRQQSFLAQLGVPVLRVEFADQEHMDYTDLPMLGAWVASGAKAAGPTRIARRDLVDAWFADFLEAKLAGTKKPRLELEAGAHDHFWLDRIQPK